jgi:Family of unknown function (DUF6335)
MADRSKQIQNKAKSENDSLTSDESELPQEVTESYGTGVHSQSDLNTGRQSLEERVSEHNEDNPELYEGDLNTSGEESVGGTAPTPDQDLVDELGAAVGLEMDDKTNLQTTEILEQRDSRRWELEPKSSGDYEERREE